VTPVGLPPAGRLLTRGEFWLWLAALGLVGALLVLVRFESADPDSALYAGISARLADEPVSRWLAPEWWGFWPEARMTGLFREHPAGVFLLPALVDRLGMPAEQGAYLVGVGAGLASLLLIAVLISRTAGPADARAALVLLQLMPVAFIFRVRANHEYPMLVCLLLTLVGLDSVRRSWGWTAVVAIGLTAALLVKGVFVILVFAGAGLWVLINPTAAPGSLTRPVAAFAVALAVMAATAWTYDVLYLRATGETFWAAYWQRQLGPLTVVTPIEGASTLVRHIGFYLTRLLWHPMPWSLALLAGAWRLRGQVGHWWRTAPAGLRRGLVFVLGFSAASVVILSPSSRFAERYAFSATFAVAAAGAVAAWRQWPGLRRALTTLEQRVPALPVTVWLSLMVLRLVLGPVLPRV